MSRRPARLDLETVSNENEENQRGIMMTNEELEESKNGIRIVERQNEGNFGKINKSDAFHTESNR